MNSTTPSTSRKRKVCFGGTRVFRVEKVPVDLKPEVWYGSKELEILVASEMASMKDCDLRRCSNIAGRSNSTLKQVMPSLSLIGSKYHSKSNQHTCESHTPRGLEKYHTNTKTHYHVRRVLTVFQSQCQQHKGGWEPQSLRRVSQNMSKDDLKAALKRAKRDFAEVYGTHSKSSVPTASSSPSSRNKIGSNRLVALLTRAA